MSLYLLSCDKSGTATAGANPIIIKTFTVPSQTLHQLGTYSFSNEIVDLSQVSNLSSGTYRLGGWINSNKAISGSIDDQSDNVGLLQSSGGTSSSSVINYDVTGAVSAILNISSDFKENISGIGNGKILLSKAYIHSVLDLQGNLIVDQALADNIDISKTSSGLYFILVSDNNGNVLSRGKYIKE